MPSLFPPVLFLHIGCGLVATLVGVAPLITRKGSPIHRLSGRMFAGFMGVALVAAWTLTALRFNAYFAALSATATLQLFAGLRVLGRKRPDLRREDRATALDWLVTTAVVAIGAWVLWLLLSGAAVTGPRAVIWSLAGAALGFGGWDVWRFTRPTAFPFFPDLWFYEHLVRMLGAYAAVVSAFAGNVLPFAPEPWRQLWPILLFQGLTVMFIVSHAARRRRLQAAAVA